MAIQPIAKIGSKVPYLRYSYLTLGMRFSGSTLRYLMLRDPFSLGVG